MAIALRIILGFIVTAFFVGIIFSTFFTQTQYLSVSSINNTELLIHSWGVFSHDISGFESLYSNKEISPETISLSWATHDVSVREAWKYLSSFRSTTENYVFSWTWFVVTQEWVGEIFIDTLTTPWKVFVYSVNTPLTISFFNEDKTEKYVDVHLTPHMYLEFQANRGRYLKNADRIRIGTVFKLWYIWELWQYWEDEEYISKYFESEDDFLNSILSSIDQHDRMSQELLSEFSKQSVAQIPGYNMIQRYINLFVNDEKKIVFYKNKILEWYLKILKIESMDKWVKNQVTKDLQKLKSLDAEAYNDLLELQENILIALHASHGEHFVVPTLIFASFLDEAIVNELWYFPLYGASLFNLYNRDNNFSNELSKKYLQSFSVYVDSLEVNSNEFNLRYDYFSYYLERKLLHLLNTQDEETGISAIVLTFENYIETTLKNDDYSDVAKVSRLFVFSEILKNIDNYLRSKYFFPERNASNVLELNTSNNASGKDIVDLKRNIDALYGIYEVDKKHLAETSSRDVWIMNDIVNMWDKIDEYLSALRNYETYKTQYDVSKINLLALDTFWDKQDDALSEDKMRNYLSQFVWISFLNTSITVENGLYYRVENLNIWGKNFTFSVFPSSEFKLSDIMIDGVTKPSQYKLSKIKEEWDIKFKIVPEDEKENYDFSRFFILTFFQVNEIDIEEFVTTTTVQEDKTEVVFKKDILLGNPWEFTILESYLNIEYANITLEKNGENYKIFLDDINVFLEVLEDTWKQERYWGILKSEYVLNKTDHYFRWASVQVYEDYEKNDKKFLFEANPIFIGWKIHISDMKDILKTLMKQTLFYSSVYSNLHNIPWVWDINLQYTVFNNKLSIKFASAWKKYTILLHDWEIESMYKWSSKVSQDEILISDIENYID